MVGAFGLPIETVPSIETGIMVFSARSYASRTLVLSIPTIEDPAVPLMVKHIRRTTALSGKVTPVSWLSSQENEMNPVVLFTLTFPAEKPRKVVLKLSLDLCVRNAGSNLIANCIPIRALKLVVVKSRHTSVLVAPLALLTLKVSSVVATVVIVTVPGPVCTPAGKLFERVTVKPVVLKLTCEVPAFSGVKHTSKILEVLARVTPPTVAVLQLTFKDPAVTPPDPGGVNEAWERPDKLRLVTLLNCSAVAS